MNNKKRTIQSVFTIREDYDNAGVCFKASNKLVEWKDLTAQEQRRTLNAWAAMYELFYRFLKEEEDDTE